MKSDSELMSEFRRGNRRSLHMLMRRYHVKLLNFLFPLTGSAHIAEELTQRTFLRVSVDLEARSAAASSPFSTILYRTGYVCWLDYLRQSAAHTQALPFVVSHVASQASGEPLTNQTVNQPIASEAPPNGIAQFILTLPNELRAIVVLREVCGLGYSDIAAVFNVSQNSVKHRMHDAFRQLNTSLNERAALPPPQLPGPPKSAMPNIERSEGGHASGGAQ
jgi:RNA polymerase sigma factor (sigma-70 family)